MGEFDTFYLFEVSDGFEEVERVGEDAVHLDLIGKSHGEVEP